MRVVTLCHSPLLSFSGVRKGTSGPFILIALFYPFIILTFPQQTARPAIDQTCWMLRAHLSLTPQTVLSTRFGFSATSRHFRSPRSYRPSNPRSLSRQSIIAYKSRQQSTLNLRTSKVVQVKGNWDQRSISSMAQTNGHNELDMSLDNYQFPTGKLKRCLNE